MRCRACHAIGAGARNKAGPQLNGIVGRKAAAVPGFNYSDAMNEAAGSGLVWTEAEPHRLPGVARCVPAQRRHGLSPA